MNEIKVINIDQQVQATYDLSQADIIATGKRLITRGAAEVSIAELDDYMALKHRLSAFRELFMPGLRQRLADGLSAYETQFRLVPEYLLVPASRMKELLKMSRVELGTDPEKLFVGGRPSEKMLGIQTIFTDQVTDFTFTDSEHPVVMAHLAEKASETKEINEPI